MSTDAVDGRAAPGSPPASLAGRLGYLLKHVQLRLTEVTETALAPYGIDGREWAVLIVIDGQEPMSQLQIANRLEVDRTTMVAMVDELERKGLVQRRPHPADRRKNAVELTPSGRDTLRSASEAGDAAVARFLAPLGDDAQQFKDALRVLLSASGHD